MKHLVVIVLVSLCTILQGQNLVPNHSFEDVDCPEEITIHTINYAHDWFDNNYTQSTDAYHTCFEDEFFTPPYNVTGTSYPHSGEGMGGFIPFPVANTSNYREIISVVLTEPLKKDSAYCVSFMVKNSKYFDIMYGTDNIGILFTEDTITEYEVTNYDPHIRSTEGIILDENKWVEIQGYYIANGGEKHLNLGTFGNKNEIEWYFDWGPVLPNSLPSHLYYFVDDVFVKKCDKDSILKVTLEIPNVFTPNGDGKNDLFYISHQNIQELNVSIINRWGNTVFNYDGLTHVWSGELNGTPASDGTYFYVVRGEDKFGNQIERYGTVTIIR